MDCRILTLYNVDSYVDGMRKAELTLDSGQEFDKTCAARSSLTFRLLCCLPSCPWLGQAALG